MAANLALFKSKIKPYKMSSRGSTINNAFAAALAMAHVYDEEKLIEALAVLGQNPEEPLRCVYCDGLARTIDHLHGLVRNSTYTGHGHVIGNLVPCCNSCNETKGKKLWRDWAVERGTSEDQVRRIAEYELLAPPTVSEADLKALYPDLMAAYESLRLHTRDLMKTADHLAREVQRLESQRLHRQMVAESE